MIPRAPFKFLDAYTKDDKDIYFGREAEIEELHARLLQSRLTLVYGPSGTGKTSLVQCGLAQNIPESDWFPLIIRYSDDLPGTLTRAIAAWARTPVAPAASLAERLQSLYLDYFKPITLIFDQCEELFIFGTGEAQRCLAQEIAALLEATVELRIVIVIREEYLAELTAFEPLLPDLFSNRLRVERMGRAGALRAIAEPCRVCGINIETGLAERILERLGATQTGAVELTYLQVLLDKLYARSLNLTPDPSPTKKGEQEEMTHSDAPRRNEETGRSASIAAERQNARFDAERRNEYKISLTIRGLEALGTLGDILAQFLDEQLAALSGAEAALGEAVLKTLITPDGTKRKMSVDDVAAALPNVGLSATLEQVTTILNHFVAVRVLNEKDEIGRYELRHDSLAAKIFARLSTVEKDLLEVLQTVENRYKEYQKRHTLLDQAALDYVAPYESRLQVNRELLDFIVISRNALKKARRRKLMLLAAIALAVFLVVSGLAVMSYVNYRKAEEQRQIAEEQRKYAEKQTQAAQLNEVETLHQTSRALFLAHDELGALFTIVKAGIKLKQINEPITLTNKILLSLQKIVYGIQEKNRMSVTFFMFS